MFIFVSLLLKLAMASFYWWSFDVYEGSSSNSGLFFSIAVKLPKATKLEVLGDDFNSIIPWSTNRIFF